MVATNDVLYHQVSRRALQDVMTCVREKCTVHDAGYRLHSNAERHLKPAAEMIRLFRQYPDAINRTQEIADACSFSLDELKYQYVGFEVISKNSFSKKKLLLFLEEVRKASEGIPNEQLFEISHPYEFNGWELKFSMLGKPHDKPIKR